MSRKTVSIKPQARKSHADALNAWVAQGAENVPGAVKPDLVEKEPMKRLSIDLPASLHKELMMYCATNGTKAAQVVRTLIEQTIRKP